MRWLRELTIGEISPTVFKELFLKGNQEQVLIMLQALTAAGLFITLPEDSDDWTPQHKEIWKMGVAYCLKEPSSAAIAGLLAAVRAARLSDEPRPH